ncbi:hypothetical protein [Phenylobacterium sp.]|nr:hypothetical protein [Phenylobacterium sp.]
MAKSQKRSGREPRKPKAEKPKPATSSREASLQRILHPGDKR